MTHPFGQPIINETPRRVKVPWSVGIIISLTIKKGIYAILLEMPQSVVVRTRGRLFQLKAGHYVYIGSAMNGLAARIGRHLSTAKRKHWHIDYLLEYGIINGVVSAETCKSYECDIAAALSVLPSVPGFGCSDCRCRSHLFRGESETGLLRATEAAFRQAGLPELQTADTL